MYEVIIPKKVQNLLMQLSDKFYYNIRAKILELEENPRPIGNIKLTNSEEYRLRVGQFRILYEIDDNKKKIFIYDIVDRKDAYKRK